MIDDGLAKDGQEPKYAEVKRILRERIREMYAVGTKIPSTAKLHRELGLSEGTINHAIRELVEEGLLERFKSRGTFVKSDRKIQNVIGFLWRSVMEGSTHTTPYTAAILHAVQEEAERRGKQVLVGGTGAPGSIPKFTGQDGGQVAGVIILFNSNPRIIDAYHDEGTAVVLVDPFVMPASVPFVTSSHFSAAREATLHLAQLGHRRIVHVTVEFPVSCMQVGERILGYQEAMREARLEEYARVHVVRLDSEKLQINQTPFMSISEAIELQAAEPFFNMVNREEPTALYCFDDGVASWILKLCREQNIRIPEDISIVGTNDDGLAAHLWPPLTTIRLALDEVGRTAVSLLDELIEKNCLTGGGRVIPVSLIERRSARPLPFRRMKSTGSDSPSYQEPPLINN